MDNLLIIYLLQTVLTSILFGLILTIQVVHYPSFKFVSMENFFDFHQFHKTSISVIVIPAMLLEVIIAGFLSLYVKSPLDHLNFFIVVMIWLSTFFISVPLHNQLTLEKTDILINRLVITNWIRTLLWKAKFILSLLLLYSKINV